MSMRLIKIITGIGFVLILIILFLNQAIYTEIVSSVDYYWYVELGRNIFNKLNFIAPWQFENLISYPPFCPILIYILTLFTGDPLVSFRYLNAFSVSFCLIPLFLVTKKLLNNISAFLVTIFMIYYFGLMKPCYTLNLDCFFTFLTITVFWLIWEVSTSERLKAASFILLGFLLSLTYLTKFHGIIYCLWAIISIFYFLKRNHCGLKTILKKISFLMLGFLPLVIVYHSFLYVNSRQQQVYDSLTVGFIDGKGKGEKDHFMLNPEGTEFNHLSRYQNFTVISFCLKYPEFVRDKYIEGLKRTFKIITKRVFPFKALQKKDFSTIVQYILLILVLTVLVYHKYRFKIIYVFLFAFIVLLVPLYYLSERYLMPFMPFYFILWLMGINGLYNLFEHNKKVKYVKYILKLLIIISAVVLVYNYSMKFYKAVLSFNRKQECPYKEYLKAAAWIKNDSKNKTGRSKIMSRKNTFAYLANAYFIALPYENDWGRIIKFALMKDVDYIILDKATLFGRREDQWEYLTKTAPRDIHLGYEDTDIKNVIMIFKIQP